MCRILLPTCPNRKNRLGFVNGLGASVCSEENEDILYDFCVSIYPIIVLSP